MTEAKDESEKTSQNKFIETVKRLTFDICRKNTVHPDYGVSGETKSKSRSNKALYRSWGGSEKVAMRERNEEVLFKRKAKKTGKNRNEKAEGDRPSAKNVRGRGRFPSRGESGHIAGSESIDVIENGGGGTKTKTWTEYQMTFRQGPGTIRNVCGSEEMCLGERKERRNLRRPRVESTLNSGKKSTPTPAGVAAQSETSKLLRIGGRAPTQQRNVPASAKKSPEKIDPSPRQVSGDEEKKG